MESTPAPIVYKCERCGCESTIKEAFLVKKKSAFEPGSTLCFECAVRKSSSSFSPIIWGFMAIITGINLLMDVQAGLVILAIWSGLLLSYPLALLHELSHVLAARLMGLRIFGVHLGAGRVIYTTRLFGFRWYLHKIPVSGAAVLSGMPMPFFQMRKLFSVLAGPAFHALMIALMAWLLSAGRVQSPAWLFAFVITMILINGVYLVVNLMPTRGVVALGVIGTDGYQMLQILQGKQPPEVFASYYALATYDAVDIGDFAAARRWYETGNSLYPANSILANMECYLLCLEEQYSQARELCLRQIESEANLSEVLKYAAYNNIAYTNLMLEDPTLLPQADELSRLSFKNMPWEPSVISTRGQTLLALGKVEEGIPMLKVALKRSSDRISKAFTSALLSQAEFRQGRLSEAVKYFQAAVKLDPHCVLIKKIKIEMGQALPAKMRS